MQWLDDAPDNWDDAPDDPPETLRADAGFVELNDGYVLRPEDDPETGNSSSNSIYITTLMDPNDLEERPQDDGSSHSYL